MVGHNTRWSRRRFAGRSLAAGGGLLLLGTKLASAAESTARRLRFYNLHTGETLSTVYWEEGHYVPSGLAEIDHMLRDFRTGELHTMDPKLLDLVHRLQVMLEDDEPVAVISGYRSAATNAMLARKSEGVAKNSFHIKGMAIDLRLPERRLSAVREAALAIGGGGVGYYPKSDFVHMDTGPIRAW